MQRLDVTPRLVAVVAQEQLLERRRVARERAHAEPAQRARSTRRAAAVSTSKRDAVAVDLEAVDAGEVGEPVGRSSARR